MFSLVTALIAPEVMIELSGLCLKYNSNYSWSLIIFDNIYYFKFGKYICCNIIYYNYIIFIEIHINRILI